MNLVKDFERLDDLQINNLKIIQNPDWFCFGTDSVAIANFVTARPNQTVIDFGTYSAVIPILLSAKIPAKKIVGLEIQSNAVEMAKRSVKLNNLEDKIEIVEGDIKNADKIFGRNSFDIVVVNPPYKAKSTGLINETDTKTIARHEILCTLEDIVKSAKNILTHSGSLFMVHKPERLIDIITLMRKYNIEPKRLKFVHYDFNKPPCLVLIEGKVNGKSYLTVEEPLKI